MKRLLMSLMLTATSFSAAMAATSTVSYAYDSQGRLASAVYVSGSTTRTVTYNYDAAGNRTTVATN